VKRKILLTAICFIALSDIAGLLARDINLDAIYLKTGSAGYDRLLEKKVEAYQVSHSLFIDRDVAFAFWADGFNLLYVKELTGISIIYSHNRNSRNSQEIVRLTGTITAARISANGKYLFIKRFQEYGNSIPRGETLALNVSSKRVRILESSYPFIDFSLAPGGNSLLYESKEGIIEYEPEIETRSLVVQKSVYAGLARPGAPSIAFLSPNRKKTVILCGSGGSYSSRIMSGGESWQIPGITSSSELYWLDNNQLVYRRGDAGNYSVSIYDTASKKSTTLVNNSLNTNIQYSVFPRMISYLKDQVICFYDLRSSDSVITGLEGEDVSFSPDGNRFISLYLKKLFLTGVTTVKRKNMEMGKIARQIMVLYQDLLSSGKDLSNEYSGEYIRKKILIYGKISE
jgi:hypothetical protein